MLYLVCDVIFVASQVSSGSEHQRFNTKHSSVAVISDTVLLASIITALPRPSMRLRAIAPVVKCRRCGTVLTITPDQKRHVPSVR